MDFWDELDGYLRKVVSLGNSGSLLLRNWFLDLEGTVYRCVRTKLLNQFIGGAICCLCCSYEKMIAIAWFRSTLHTL